PLSSLLPFDSAVNLNLRARLDDHAPKNPIASVPRAPASYPDLSRQAILTARRTGRPPIVHCGCRTHRTLLAKDTGNDREFLQQRAAPLPPAPAGQFDCSATPPAPCSGGAEPSRENL